jgi:hypothetical protein
VEGGRCECGQERGGEWQGSEEASPAKGHGHWLVCNDGRGWGCPAG